MGLPKETGVAPTAPLSFHCSASASVPPLSRTESFDLPGRVGTAQPASGVAWQSSAHEASQPSPDVALPSSHCSAEVMMSLPHAVTVQFASQPSPEMASPSSQASPAVTTAFPHAVAVQAPPHPSPSTRLPSSHCSQPSVTVPSSHAAVVQSAPNAPGGLATPGGASVKSRVTRLAGSL